MELHGKYILEILGKPLSLPRKFIFVLAERYHPKSHGSNSDYKPSPSTHASITANPLIPAFLLLSSSPVGSWLTTANELPTWAQIFSFLRKQKPHSLPRAREGVRVWTKKQSGFYYCRGGTLFGNKPGKMMAQVDALMSGYRPFGGNYCANSQPVVASADAPAQQPSGTENAPTKAVESSTLVVENQPEGPMSSEDVKVWGLKKLDFYYCRDDALFGVKPGRLMTQAGALAAGLIPSYHACSGSKANLASAGGLSFGTGQPSGPVNATPHPTEPSTVVSEKPAKADPSVNVWVKKEFGFYYCRNDVLFGNRPEQLMSQANALTAGYRPSDSHCTNRKQTNAAAQRLSPHTFPGTM